MRVIILKEKGMEVAFICGGTGIFIRGTGPGDLWMGRGHLRGPQVIFTGLFFIIDIFLRILSRFCIQISSLFQLHLCICFFIRLPIL